jgi:transmembrane sensor
MDNLKSKQELLEKYSKGKCTPEEQRFVENWYNQQAEQLSDQLPAPDYEHARDEIWLKLQSAVLGAAIVSEEKNVSGEQIVPIKLLKNTKSAIVRFRLTAAAVLLLCLGAGFFAYRSYLPKKTTQFTRSQDLPPGGNTAFLTLADGSRIALTDTGNDKLAEQQGVRISSTAEGQLIYTPTNTTLDSKEINQLNTIETPKGGQYQLRLPDGTKVWLNAASKLNYPVSFKGLKERRVILEGEAYFEVSPNKKQPFRVASAGQEVEVLGTHFNISSYADDNTTRTTLLEGSVKVAPLGYAGGHEGQAVWPLGKTLKPGQQAFKVNAQFQVTQADTLAAIAWKKGDFVFNSDIKTIMQQISRWYNVTVVYQGNITNEEFGGTISRSKNINEILDVLESTNRIHFKLEGRRITVMP